MNNAKILSTTSAVQITWSFILIFLFPCLTKLSVWIIKYVSVCNLEVPSIVQMVKLWPGDEMSAGDRYYFCWIIQVDLMANKMISLPEDQHLYDFYGPYDNVCWIIETDYFCNDELPADLQHQVFFANNRSWCSVITAEDTLSSIVTSPHIHNDIS